MRKEFWVTRFQGDSFGNDYDTEKTKGGAPATLRRAAFLRLQLKIERIVNKSKISKDSYLLLKIFVI